MTSNTQLLANGVVAGAVYLLVALGFGVVYSTLRFFHFAHGIIFTAGAYFAFLFIAWFGLPLVVSVVSAVALAVVLGCLIELAVYRPLRRRAASPLILLLASLGVYVILQNVISMVFGDDAKSIRVGQVKEGICVFGARITEVQIIILCTAIGLAVGLGILQKNTRMGKAMRAIASDSWLAVISGINRDGVALWTFALSSAIAALAGILFALDVNMTPTIGMRALMMAIIVVIIGGRGSIPGMIGGALLLGITEHLAVWKISSQWQDAVAFFILLAFLLFKPQGLAGRRDMKATV